MTRAPNPPTPPTASDFEASLRAAETAKGRPTEQSRSSASLARAHDDSSMDERPRMDHWSPPSMLSLPENDDIWVYRWIAEYVNGSHMANRLNAARREGYEFVKIDALPEGFIVDEDAKGDGLARVGGLIMARLPRRFAEQRQRHYQRQSEAALSGANQLQGVAGKDAVEENRGTRTLDGRAAGEALRSMARS